MHHNVMTPKDTNLAGDRGGGSHKEDSIKHCLYDGRLE